MFVIGESLVMSVTHLNKVKIALEQTIKAQRESRGNLGARCRWVVNTTPRPFTPGKGTRSPLYRRVGGP
jgi:hypothetical protein